MEYNEIINIIVSEPIYLSIIILLVLAFIYSVLKKFFKLLVVLLILLIAYVSFLIYNNEDLPGESDQIIYPFINEAKQKANEIIDEISK